MFPASTGWLQVIPLVRSNIHIPDARIIVITIVTHRETAFRLGLTTAHTTKARPITGIENIMNINPILALAIDSSRRMERGFGEHS